MPYVERNEIELTGLINECQENVEMIKDLFCQQVDYAMFLYNDLNEVTRTFTYITYKIECIRDQELEGIKIDSRLAEECLYNLEFIMENLKDDKDMLKKVKNRHNIFKSFLTIKDKNDKVYATVQGLTDTLRFRHSKPIVNLPSKNKYGGKEIRSLLIPPSSDHIMCGTDIKGLEDKTKQHYISFFDIYYKNETESEGFDPHIDIGVLSGILTKGDALFFKNYDINNPKQKIRYENIKNIRSKAKKVNFACTYGASPSRISEILKCSLAEAKKLHTAYWNRNKAIKKVAKSFKVKEILTKIPEEKDKYIKDTWIYNPVSGMWLFSKSIKDRFSIINQSTGVYFFDTYLKYVRRGLSAIGIKVIMQYHDEILFTLKKGDRKTVESILEKAINLANKELKLSVTININIKFGNNYFECH